MSIILIGMPGAGKTTLGKQLSKQLSKPFVDTDDLIARSCGTSLQAYVDRLGYLSLRQLEERVLLDSDFTDTVVATGGSVVYSRPGMLRLSGLGLVIYLEISLATMLSRVTNQSSRGLASEKGLSLEQIYHERRPLYEKYSAVRVTLDGHGPEQSLKEVLGVIKESEHHLKR